MYQNYEEDDDDFDDLDLIAMQKFKSKCDICGLGINWYHRYYYKCSQSSCSYSLHKLCGELSITIQFPSHPIHTLLLKSSNSWSCHSCLVKHQDGIDRTNRNFETAEYPNLIHYPLPDESYNMLPHHCNYRVDVHCGFVPERITHEAHPNHLLLRADASSIQTTMACGACNEIIKGIDQGDVASTSNDAPESTLSSSSSSSGSSSGPSGNNGEPSTPIYTAPLTYEGPTGQSSSSCSSSVPLKVRAVSDLYANTRESEQDVNSLPDLQRGVYKLLNMKFGRLFDLPDHQHTLAFLAGTESDGLCYY
ncbi:hypothetical protein L1987_29441 [Smallanthus sonchifolius]|uniref:Uncharacterized protein n=1 Tax=Smallanthus sonchifolius TaxID=185202 RepID=A0ACB9HZW4_9ASTR|nr:hypothetical protein L1987_29441 [Smallanthus sonchifolius]